MLQAMPVQDTGTDLFDSRVLTSEMPQRRTESEESIMDKADFATASMRKRLSHEQVFGSLRGKLDAR